MMALSSTSRTRVTVQRPAARRTIVAKALSVKEFTDMVGNAFLRIFTAPTSSVKQFAESNFTGKISHHGTSRRPFRDGYVSTMAPSEPSPQVERSDADAKEYLQGAVNRVANHAFKGDDTEPAVYPGNEGFKGDIHTGRGAERDGFHAKRH